MMPLSVFPEPTKLTKEQKDYIEDYYAGRYGTFVLSGKITDDKSNKLSKVNCILDRSYRIGRQLNDHHQRWWL